MKIVQAAVVVTEASPPVLTSEDADETTKSEVENQVLPADTEKEAPEMLTAEETPDESE